MSASTPPVPAGAPDPVPVPASLAAVTAPFAQATPVTRHDRAADALISSYLRELLDDEPVAPAQPDGAAARGRSAAT